MASDTSTGRHVGTGPGFSMTLLNARQLEREFGRYVDELTDPIRTKLVVKSMNYATKRGRIQMKREIAAHASISLRYIKKAKFVRAIVAKVSRRRGLNAFGASDTYFYAAYGWRYFNFPVSYYKRFKSSPGGPSSGGFGTRYLYYNKRQTLKTGFTHKDQPSYIRMPGKEGRIHSAKAALHTDATLSQKGRKIAEEIFMKEYRRQVENYARAQGYT